MYDGSVCHSTCAPQPVPTVSVRVDTSIGSIEVAGVIDSNGWRVPLKTERGEFVSYPQPSQWAQFQSQHPSKCYSAPLPSHPGVIAIYCPVAFFMSSFGPTCVYHAEQHARSVIEAPNSVCAAPPSIICSIACTAGTHTTSSSSSSTVSYDSCCCNSRQGSGLSCCSGTTTTTTGQLYWKQTDHFMEPIVGKSPNSGHSHHSGSGHSCCHHHRHSHRHSRRHSHSHSHQHSHELSWRPSGGIGNRHPCQHAGTFHPDSLKWGSMSAAKDAAEEANDAAAAAAKATIAAATAFKRATTPKPFW